MANQPQPSPRITRQLSILLKRLLDMGDDKAPESETIENIKAGVDFRGAKLWILILAIFTASLGLNVNSAAVIIGAMLISPLMGPIIGMGLGLGINDFELLKRSFRSFLTATVFSVLTATVYFLITPLTEAHSELLARTSPTIYDVFIALCGGLAGIIALSSTSQRNGNVVPGVAIATAIMPPLCTSGFGLATGNWVYAAGAFYLYLINVIFIALATYAGVLVMHFNKKVFVNKQREKRVKHIIVTLTIATVLPAALLTYQLVSEDIYAKRANEFISKALTFDGTQIVSREINCNKRTIKVMLWGTTISESELASARKKLEAFHLDNTQLTVLQGTDNKDIKALRNMIQEKNGMTREQQQNAQMLANLQNQVEQLQGHISDLTYTDRLATNLRAEMHVLFPEVQSFTLGRNVRYIMNDSTCCDTLTVAYIELAKKLEASEKERLTNWLHNRIRTPNVKVVTTLGETTGTAAKRK